MRLKLKGESVAVVEADRIVDAFGAYGYRIEANEAYAAWEKYSRQSNALWLDVPNDDREIFVALNDMFEPDEFDGNDS